MRSRPPPTQDRVLALAFASPGVRARDVAHRLGVHVSTAEYHLKRLVRRGHLTDARVGRKRLYYPAGNGWCGEARRIHGRLTPAARDALERLVAGGAVSRHWLRARGHSRSASRWAVERLGEVGLLVRVGHGSFALDPRRASCARAVVETVACTSCRVDVTCGTRPGVHRRAAGSTSPAPGGHTPA